MGELEAANQSYDAAIALATDTEERHRIERKRHRAGFALRDGARIAYYLHGAGEETLLFVNPVVYGLEVFQPIVERLCQEFRIVTIDPRGTGASDPLQRPYGLSQHAEDVRAVIEQAGIGAVTGVGISRGSNLLVRLAHTHPELVRRLVLIGAPTDIGASDSPVQRRRPPERHRGVSRQRRLRRPDALPHRPGLLRARRGGSGGEPRQTMARHAARDRAQLL